MYNDILLTNHHLIKKKIFFAIFKVAPKINHFDFGDEPSNFGDLVSVQCIVPSGDLPVDFKWLFNNKPFINYDGISTAKMGKRRSVLTIESVNGKNAGNYTCVASNQAEIVNFTAKLIVNGNVFLQSIYLCNTEID